MNCVLHLSAQFRSASFCLPLLESLNYKLSDLALLLLIMTGKSLKPCHFKNVKYYTNKKGWMTTTIFM
jgi:hypothetical protein